MQPVDSATLITGVGIDGDKHAQGSSLRQVLIVDKEALDAVSVDPGTIKENLTVEGLQVMALPPRNPRADWLRSDARDHEDLRAVLPDG
jgi:hypothetical protein